MSRARDRARAEQDAADADRYRKVIERTAATLKAYAKSGEKYVLIEEVTDLLGQDPYIAPPPPKIDPNADPLTGCLPVTAKQPG